MRKILLMSSALMVSGLLSGGVAEAACIQTPTCSSLGYTSSSSCTGGTKCPFGNAWNCTVVDLTNKITEITNKITTIEEKITEIEENGGGSGETTTPDYTNCTVGAILYSDKTCSADLIAGKTPIGVVFNSGERLAVALKTSALVWSTTNFDIPLLGGDENDADGQYNTRVGLEYCRANDKVCPAFEYTASYQTEGTEAGDWYFPAIMEVREIFGVKNTLNETLKKIGGTEFPAERHWSSSEGSSNHAWDQNFNNGDIYYYYNKINYSNYVRPVLAF